MLRELRRFQAFSGVAPALLRTITQHARLMDVPDGRWLVRRGRTVGGSHFLVRGRVRTVGPDRVVDAGTERARQPVYPGAEGLFTLSHCRLLFVRDEGLELLAASSVPGLVTVVEDDDCWQARFLRSRLMAGLAKPVWQQVLSSLEPMPVFAGETLIEEGARAGLDRCFIMARGEAQVLSGGCVQASVGSGDLFGEDALITDRPRNATVRITRSGVVMALPAARFRSLLVEVLRSGALAEPAGMCDCTERRSIAFDSVRGLRERIAALDPHATYLVQADAPEIAALALFQMRKSGLAAYAGRGTSSGAR